MAQGGSNKVANGLVSASCAAVLAVYIAGYVRTQSAADQFTKQVAERRPVTQSLAPNAALIEDMKTHGQTLRQLPAPAAPSLRREAKHRPAPVILAEPAPPTAIPEIAEPVESVPAPPPVAAPVPEPAPVAEVKAEPAPAPAALVWKDGTYTGWGYSRHGNIEATVIIEGGKIALATISQCRTRYSCSVIDRLPPQVAQRQSPDVDYVSGATQSADAFYGGVVAALAKAK